MNRFTYLLIISSCNAFNNNFINNKQNIRLSSRKSNKFKNINYNNHDLFDNEYYDVNYNLNLHINKYDGVYKEWYENGNMKKKLKYDNNRIISYVENWDKHGSKI